MKRTLLLIMLCFLSYVTIFADTGVSSHINNRVLASRSLEYFTARIDTKLYKPGARFVLIQTIRDVDGTVREEIYGHAKYVGLADPRHADIGLFKQIRGYQATSDMYVRYVSERNPWNVFGGYLKTSGWVEDGEINHTFGLQLGASHTFRLSQNIGLEPGMRLRNRMFKLHHKYDNRGISYIDTTSLDIFTKFKLINIGTPMIRVEPFLGGYRSLIMLNKRGSNYNYGIILGSDLVIHRRFIVGLEYNLGGSEYYTSDRHGNKEWLELNSLIFSAGFRF